MLTVGTAQQRGGLRRACRYSRQRAWRRLDGPGRRARIGERDSRISARWGRCSGGLTLWPPESAPWQRAALGKRAASARTGAPDRRARWTRRPGAVGYRCSLDVSNAGVGIGSEDQQRFGRGSEEFMARAHEKPAKGRSGQPARSGTTHLDARARPGGGGARASWASADRTSTFLLALARTRTAAGSTTRALLQKRPLRK